MCGEKREDNDQEGILGDREGGQKDLDSTRNWTEMTEEKPQQPRFRHLSLCINSRSANLSNLRPCFPPYTGVELIHVKFRSEGTEHQLQSFVLTDATAKQ